MESRLIICVVILALVVDGGKAQLDVCGNVTVNPKIVGGSDALTGSWPWMASLYYRGDIFCGGTLINDMWILTAASCLTSFITSSSITVSLGRLNQQAPNPNEVSRSVAQIINHPYFNYVTLDNDIALLRLSSSVPLNNYIRPVCLAADKSVFRPGRMGWITGWGSRSSSSGSTAERMQQAEVPVVSNKKCKDTYGKSMITDNMMCAGGERKGVCAGDGGGPMVVKQGNQWIQGGVMSFVYRYGCAQTNKPDGYARVSRYQSWIKSQITSNQPGFVYNSSNVISGKSNVFSLLLLSILPLVFSL